MKKLVAVLALFVLITVGVFAQIKMSVGGGLLLDYSGGNGVEVMGTEAGFDFLSYGLYSFFDATYVEASLYFTFGTSEGNGQGYSGDTTSLGVTVLAKYPFELGPVIVFPLAGIGYNNILSIDPEMPGLKSFDFNKSGLLFGGGIDFNITDNLFLRATAVFQTNFVNLDSTWGMGTQIKVGIAYRF